jgi:phage protein D
MSDDLFYRVTVNAADASYELSDDIDSFTVEQRGSDPDLLTIQLADPFHVFGMALQEGMEVEVEIGTDSDHSLIFRGRLYHIDASFPSHGVPRLEVKAYDRGMRMGLHKRNRRFQNLTLSALVQQIAAPYFNGNVQVTLSGDPTFDAHGIRQQEETDLAFLKRLAEDFGCVIFTDLGESSDGDTFHFIAEQQVMSADPDLSLYYRRSDVDYPLDEFTASIDISRLRLPRVLSGIDYDSGEAIDAPTSDTLGIAPADDPYLDESLTEFRTDDPLKAAQLEVLISAAPTVQLALRDELGPVERAATPTFVSRQQLNQIAQNQPSTSLLGMQASGAAPGVKELKARSSVAIANVGGRFSGNWYLSEVRHVLNHDGYFVHFECQR